ncbi:MAG: 16S rRNA (guanine(527)-N(7))-methyltransferase RsmG [Proteobacteria bacterium]|nr:16S rRNA (guanine(527)-N(7))-methyltransferase RsmG [Pseudomonadota bacterium]
MTGWEQLPAWSREVAGLELSSDQLTSLRTYVDLLMTWNRKISLVSQQSVDDILVKHVVDSLCAAAHCEGAGTVADLGSGGGFPGLVIGLIHRQTRVCLMESRGKKASFLEEACRVLRLSSCTVYHGRIEAAAAIDAHRGAYDIAVSRALALLAPSGYLLAMRSIGGDLGPYRCVVYQLPDGSPRRLAFGSGAAVRER